MKHRILTLLAGRDERLVSGALVLLVALIAFEGWQLVLKTPLAKYQQARETRVALATAMAASPRSSPELGGLSAEVQALVRKLEAELVSDSDDRLTAVLMTELDRSAAEHGVRLKAVRPGSRSRVGAFDEVSYDVLADGKYVSLSRWLIELERVMGGRAAVQAFTLRTETGHVSATARLALYRSAQTGQRK